MYNGQLLQDAFVDLILDINNGQFLDIGAGTGGLPTTDPAFYSNTYFFEKYRGWNGLIIDYDKTFINFASQNRICQKECCDLSQNNINDILERHNSPKIIDYLSLDVDDVQEKVFSELNFDEYEFKVITLEHNLFHTTSKTQNHSQEHKDGVLLFRRESREILRDRGYILFCPDVVLNGYGPVEDWYINPKFVNSRFTTFPAEMNCIDIITDLKNQRW